MGIYYIVMQCFRMVYRGISHESLVFSSYTHESLGECVCKEIQVTSVIFHGIPRASLRLYYFIPCHRKHVALHNRCGAREEGRV